MNKRSRFFLLNTEKLSSSVTTACIQNTLAKRQDTGLFLEIEHYCYKRNNSTKIIPGNVVQNVRSNFIRSSSVLLNVKYFERM